MAGPRTLPRLFAHGLNVKAGAKAFGEEAQKGVIDEWHALTPQQRATKLVELVNGHLKKAGVPPVIPDPKETGTNAGQFDFENWHMEIGVKALAVTKPSVEQARDLVDTIYHEARHAEQWYRIAQLRVMQIRRSNPKISDAKLKAQIIKETQIQPDAVEAAVKAPVKDQLANGSMQALIAQGWFDSVYGSGSDHREAVLTELTAAGEALERARKNVTKSNTAATRAALQKAIARDAKANAAYKNLPEENDAWTTGPMTGPGVTKGASDMPQPPPPIEAELAGIETGLKELVGAHTAS